MRLLFRVLLGLAAAVFLAVSGLGGWLVWLSGADPVAFAARPMPAYRLAEDNSYPVERNGERRTYRELEFLTSEGAPIRVTISLPVPGPTGPRPVMVILGGLRSGQRSLDRTPALGDNIALAFEYPYAAEILDRQSSLLGRLAAARRAVRETPGQIVAILAWLRGQSWSGDAQVSLLGYSLGAVFVPVVNHKARLYGLSGAANILAFGGADLGQIVPNSLKLENRTLRWLVAGLADALLKPIEPAYHLPQMTGPTLLIIAERDELVPAISRELMKSLTPEPKTVVYLPGDHIDPRDKAVLDRVVGITADWLKANGAVNAL